MLAPYLRRKNGRTHGSAVHGVLRSRRNIAWSDRQWEESWTFISSIAFKIGQTMMTCESVECYNSRICLTQTQIENAQMRRDAAWEITGVGHVRVDSVNEQCSYAITAQRGQYAAIHSTLRLEGAPREPAIVQRITPFDPAGKPPVQFKISTALINLKTGESNLQTSGVSIDLEQMNASNQAAKNAGSQKGAGGPWQNEINRSQPNGVIPSPRDRLPGAK